MLLASNFKPAVKPASQSAAPRPKVDFECVREHVTMEQVLQHLGYFASLRGRGQQRRGPCPVHSQPTAPERTFSVHLGKNAFQCFHAESLFQKPYAVVRLRGRLYRNRSRYFAPVSRRSIN